MDRNEIRQGILNVLNDNGISVKDEETLNSEIVKIDSLTYVSVMVDLETELGVELDELLIDDSEKTYAEFIDSIVDYVEKKLAEDSI